MSGTNAHMVVRDWEDSDPAAAATAPAHLLTLSAKTDEALRERIADLIAVLEADEEAGLDLASVAYTLQTGRHHFRHRLAAVVADRADALFALRAAVTGQATPTVATGLVSRDFTAQAAVETFVGELLGRAAAAASGDEAIARESLAALAGFYCQGYRIEFDRLHLSGAPRLVSLPGYPFARERYWVERAAASAPPAVGTPVLHPLVHRNTSDLYTQRFTSTFGGSEWFLSEHVVAGRPVLPGVAHLEMVRHAVAQAVPDASAQAVAISDVVFVQPLAVVDGPLEIEVELTARAGGLAFEIRSLRPEGEPVVHSQGIVAVAPAAPLDALDLAAIEARCAREVSSDEFYEAFASVMPIALGPSFRGVRNVAVGDGEALAQLVLPERAAAGAAAFGLHPGLLDAAQQAAIALGMVTASADAPRTGGSRSSSTRSRSSSRCPARRSRTSGRARARPTGCVRSISTSRT